MAGRLQCNRKEEDEGDEEEGKKGRWQRLNAPSPREGTALISLGNRWGGGPRLTHIWAKRGIKERIPSKICPPRTRQPSKCISFIPPSRTYKTKQLTIGYRIYNVATISSSSPMRPARVEIAWFASLALQLFSVDIQDVHKPKKTQWG